MENDIWNKWSMGTLNEKIKKQERKGNKEKCKMTFQIWKWENKWRKGAKKKWRKPQKWKQPYIWW